MNDIEQILLAQAAQEAEQGPRLSDSVALGAGVGAAIGTMGGIGAHRIGNGINTLTGKTPNRFKPGNRMAGGLMGLIAGGALGAGLQNQMTSEPSGAGAILAQMQAQGGLNEDDKARLEMILRDAYSEQGLL